jgi:hypothetical protein
MYRHTGHIKRVPLEPAAPSLGYEGETVVSRMHEAAITAREWEPAIGITVSVLIYALMWALILWLTWKVGLVAAR